jgi:uncharacterized protein YegP (UPF0339 family)
MPAGLAIGLWIGCAVFLAFPVSGGSLNPARTFGPDIVSAAFPAAWIYLVGPLADAAAGGWIWQYLKRGREPDSETEPETVRSSRDGADDEQPRRRPGKFVVARDTDGKYHFTLVAPNGQVIATSETYERRQAAPNGIEALKRNAPDAEIASPDGE